MKAEKNILYWHRNDLRLHDNICLYNALNSADNVLPVYVFDLAHYRLVAPGFRKMGIHRYRYLVGTLQNLRDNYRKLGANLYIAFGEPATVLPQLAAQYHCNTLITQTEVASEEAKCTLAVAAALHKQNCSVMQYWGRTLYHVDDIPFTQATIPLTSKAYRIPTAKEAQVRAPLPMPDNIKTPSLSHWGDIPTAAELGYTAKEIDTPPQNTYPSGEDAALERLHEYTFGTEQLTAYRWTRNRSLGMDYSSKFSPFLSHGSLSPRVIYYEVKRYEKEIKKNASTWWIIFELVWRDYFNFLAWRIGNKMFYKGGRKQLPTNWVYDRDLFKRWTKGNTGIPFLDAHMRQLAATGFMSNRGRVNAASFLTRDYKIDWRWGARWFEHHLLDYDVYANWLNWQTQAFDIYYTNPVHQAWKYDQKGDFTLTWLPELKMLPELKIHLPWTLSPSERAQYNIAHYPKPVEVYKKWTRAINKLATGAVKKPKKK